LIYKGFVQWLQNFPDLSEFPQKEPWGDLGVIIPLNHP
jgi:hypothetical protein